MLELLTTEAFSEWFSRLETDAAEDVATALEVIAELGPEQAPPGSSEALLWYEHASVSRFGVPISRLGLIASRFGSIASTDSLARDLEAWGAFREYVKRVLDQLESARFMRRVTHLGSTEANRVLRAIRSIRVAADPRLRWALKLARDQDTEAEAVRPENACAEVRRLYFEALEAAGFAVTDVPAHSLALREFSRRTPAPAFRLLYGVNAEQRTALVVLGEWLDRNYYGDSVRRAERLWREFLQGELTALAALELR